MVWASPTGRSHGCTPEGSKPHPSFEACSFLEGVLVTYGILGLRLQPNRRSEDRLTPIGTASPSRSLPWLLPLLSNRGCDERNLFLLWRSIFVYLLFLNISNVLLLLYVIFSSLLYSALARIYFVIL